MTRLGITPPTYLQVHKIPAVKQLNKPNQQASDGISFRPINSLLDDMEEGLVQRGEKRRFLRNPMGVVAEGVVNYSSFGITPAADNPENNPLLIEDVHIFWSLFERVQIISPFNDSSSINLQMNILEKMIGKLESEQAPEIQAIKELKKWGNIFYDNKYDRNYQISRDKYNNILSSQQNKNLINKLNDELSKQRNKSILLTFFVNFSFCYLVMAFANSLYNIYCSEKGIKTDSPAIIGCLLLLASLAHQLFFVPKNKAFKNIQCELNKIHTVLELDDKLDSKIKYSVEKKLELYLKNTIKNIVTEKFIENILKNIVIEKIIEMVLEKINKKPNLNREKIYLEEVIYPAQEKRKLFSRRWRNSAPALSTVFDYAYTHPRKASIASTVSGITLLDY